VDVLYTAAPFYFDHLPRLHAFTGSLPPEHRAKVRALHVSLAWPRIWEAYQLPNKREIQWRDDFELFVREIQSLAGLRHVQLVLADTQGFELPSRNQVRMESMAAFLEGVRKEGMAFTIEVEGVCRRMLGDQHVS
jgi:hypothetical protein